MSAKQKQQNELEAERYALLMGAYQKDALLREALEAMTNMAPRVKEYDGCFGRMVGGKHGPDKCQCTACKIRREIG